MVEREDADEPLGFMEFALRTLYAEPTNDDDDHSDRGSEEAEPSELAWALGYATPLGSCDDGGDDRAQCHGTPSAVHAFKSLQPIELLRTIDFFEYGHPGRLLPQFEQLSRQEAEHLLLALGATTRMPT